jgi:hypothetical protein
MGSFTTTEINRERLSRGPNVPSGHEQLRIARRCPGCGHMVTIWPCIECTRLEAKDKEIDQRKLISQIEA